MVGRSRIFWNQLAGISAVWLHCSVWSMCWLWLRDTHIVIFLLLWCLSLFQSMHKRHTGSNSIHLFLSCSLANLLSFFSLYVFLLPSTFTQPPAFSYIIKYIPVKWQVWVLKKTQVTKMEHLPLKSPWFSQGDRHVNKELDSLMSAIIIYLISLAV